ncbi:MAG: hypothetical protein GF331_09350 [Chitinivibrionales bacterium]|nr:hypothetical protein [Chitinivibrionales bacterium]
MVVVMVPLAIYVISALLLFLETFLVSAALQHIRGMPHGFGTRIALACLLAPLVLLPLVPVVFLMTLDFKGKATPEGFVYAAVIWLGGIISALPSYWYLTRRRAETPAS